MDYDPEVAEGYMRQSDALLAPAPPSQIAGNALEDAPKAGSAGK